MDKVLNMYSLKSENTAIKDLDTGSRKVSMYLARFDLLDSDMDIIRKGAFTKSLQERGVNSASNRKIAFLRYHDWQKPIGKFLELREDDLGLYAVAQLSESTDGMDALADYKDGIIREHSIGFRYVKDKIRFIEDPGMEENGGGYYEVNEVQLYEGSAVTFGANEYTNVIEVSKTQGSEDIALKLHNEINTIANALASGSGTDERLHSLEMRLKFLNAAQYKLANAESFNKHSVKSEPIKSAHFDWNKVITQI